MAIIISTFLNVKPSHFYLGGKMQEALKASILLTKAGLYTFLISLDI